VQHLLGNFATKKREKMKEKKKEEDLERICSILLEVLIFPVIYT
jgi:hypothetical protein